MEFRIAGSLRVAEQAIDHRQRHVARNEERGEGVTKIVDACVAESRFLAHAFPEHLHLAQGMPLMSPGKTHGQSAGTLGRIVRKSSTAACESSTR